MMSNFNFSPSGPQLVWVIEPENKIRFRYESEGGSHGGLAGKAGKKTYPTLKLVNYKGRKQIVVKVSLHTEDNKPHVLEFKGKKNEGSKPHIQEFLRDDNTVEFKNIHILSKKKDVIEKILMERRLNNLREGMSRAARAQFEKTYTKDTKERARAILNSVRLYFEAFELDRPGVPLCSLYSEVICNQKAASKGDLRICRLSSIAGSWKGGDEIILLCEKVQKETIKVKFYETDDTGAVVWYEYADFSPLDVHYQVAIPFKTPPYKSNEEKRVYICLERNEETSEPREFTYKPDEPSSKKRKLEECESLYFPDTPDSIPSTSQPSFPSPENLIVPSGGISNFPSDDSQENYMNDNTFDIPEDINKFIQEHMGGYMEDADLPFVNLFDDFDDGSDEFFFPLAAKAYHTSSGPAIDGAIYSQMAEAQMDASQMVDYVDGPIGDKVAENVGRVVLALMGIDVGMKNITLTDDDEQKDDVETNSIKKILSKLPKNLPDLRHKKKVCSSLLLKRDCHGNTVLHQYVLAAKNIVPLLKMCHFASIDPTSFRNHKNQTALHIAVEKNNCKAVRILLRCYSNPNLKDSKGNNCYLIAALNNFPDVLREINRFSYYDYHQVSDFNDEGLTALHVAIMRKNPVLFGLLEIHMTDPNIAEKKAGKSLLHFAVDYQSCILPKLLIMPNINVNIQDFEGNTPLHIACASTNIEVVKELLLSGADPSIKNFKQNSLEENSEDESSIGQLPGDLTTNLEILNLLRSVTREVIKGPIAIKNPDSFQEPLPCEITERLSKYLDEDERWKKLGPFFLDESVMESLCLSSSPSRALLRFVKKEEKDNYLEKLTTALEFAGLIDGIRIINEHMTL